MPDSTPPKPQTREIASILGYGRDITRSYLGKLLEPQDKVLARKWFDYEVYEDLLRDDQVKSVFQQRRSAVIAREWDVVPGGDKRIDKQAAEDIRATLERMGWDNVADKMLFGVFYGYAIGECLYAREGNKIQLTTIKVRKQRRFKFDWGMKPRLITWANNYEGEALPEYKFWHYSTGADNDDDPYGLGLAHWLYWPTYFKRNGIKSWLKFLERFAQPTAKGTYGPGAEATEKAALKQALQAFGEDAAVMVPEGVAIELIEAARSGTADYGGLCDRMDAAIAKIILSQTMTTDNGSSKSQAEVHKGVALDVIKADADLIDASANNTWVKWLTDWNFPGAAYPRISRKLEDEENLNDRAARDKSLSEMGFRLTPEKVVEVYGDGYYDPASLEEEGTDQPPLVSVLGVGGTEALVGFLTALSQMSLKRENAIATLATVFGISRSDAEAMVPEDAAPPEAAPPASIDDAAALFSEQPGSVEFGSIIDHLIKWNGLDIGVEYLPGQVRFPGRRNSKKLKSGYGHIRNHKGADGEALDCYLAPEFFNEDDISDLIYEVSQLTLDGEFDEHKLMLGYYNEFEAKGAYLREMPEDMFGGIRLLDLADLEQYRKSATASPDVLKALGPIGQQFAEDAKLSDRAFAVLQVLDQSVEVDMLTFAETESNAAMEGAIGRRLLALIKPGVVDFASGGGKKCTKGLSCGGSCISKAKVCVKAMNPAQKKQYGEIVKAVKAGGDGADKALEDFKASLGGEKEAKPEVKKEQSGLATTPKVEEPKQSTPANPNRDPDLKELDDPTDQDVADYLALKAKEFESIGPTKELARELTELAFMHEMEVDTLDDAYAAFGAERRRFAKQAISEKEDALARQTAGLAEFPEMKAFIEKDIKKLKSDIQKSKKALNKLETEDGVKAAAEVKLQEDKGWVSAGLKMPNAAGKYARLKTGSQPSFVASVMTGDGAETIEFIKAAMRPVASTPRKLLGVTADATLDEIKAAYKKAAIKAHPDRGGSADAFQKVNDAYEKLIKTMEFAEYRECVDWQIVVFSEFGSGVVEFAEKKKCIKGLSCGGSCISAAKVCVKALNPAQKKQYGAIVKAVKAGGEDADKAMAEFKASLKPESANSDIPPAPRLADDWQTLPMAEQIQAFDAHSARVAEWRSSLTPDQRRRELEERIARQRVEQAAEIEATRQELRPGKAALAKAQAALKSRIDSGDLAKPQPHVARSHGFDDKLQVGPDEVGLTGQQFFYDRTILSVSFDVNGSYDRGAATPGNERSIGRPIVRFFRNRFKELPDGLIIHNTPNQADGAGDSRESIYKLAGFGKADKKGNMYGVIKGGKLIPLTGAEAFALSEMNQNSKN